MRIMVLSRDYEPLTYCTIERAVTLVYLKKAEIIQQSERMIRSIALALPVPAIIRLLYKTARRYIPMVKYSRRNIHIRDNYTCQYCGATQDLSIDHVHPVSRGGKSTWENVVTACRRCNSHKANRTPEEANLKLRHPPRKPSSLMPFRLAELFEDWYSRRV